jgi:glutathione S-transferase
MLHPLTAIVTCLALLLYFAFTWKVSTARAKYKIAAPAIIGNPDFERVFRVQQNTLENLIIFLPGLWLFSWYVSPQWASGIGLAWIVGRILFAKGYYDAAGRRGTGFAISMSASVVLVIGALIGAGMKLWA